MIKAIPVAAVLIVFFTGVTGRAVAEDGYTCRIVETIRMSNGKEITVASCVGGRDRCNGHSGSYCGPSSNPAIVRKTCEWVPENQCKSS